MSVDPFRILEKHLGRGSLVHEVTLAHSRCVAEKAREMADRVRSLRPDLSFIEEACLLHDIGCVKTWAPDIGCQGRAPYIQHGVLGAEILLAEGLPAHARVCERHTGAGLTSEEIAAANLSLPARDLLPETLEEKIICYADKFFSKNPESLAREKSFDDVVALMARYGKGQVDRFYALAALFE